MELNKKVVNTQHLSFIIIIVFVKDKEDKTIMFNITFLVFGFVFGICSNSILRLGCLLFGDFNLTYRDKYYQGNITKTINSLNWDDCALNCVTHNICTSFNYITTNRDCILLSGDVNGAIDIDKLENKTGSMFVSTDHNSRLVRNIS